MNRQSGYSHGISQILLSDFIVFKSVFAEVIAKFQDVFLCPVKYTKLYIVYSALNNLSSFIKTQLATHSASGIGTEGWPCSSHWPLTQSQSSSGPPITNLTSSQTTNKTRRKRNVFLLFFINKRSNLKSVLADYDWPKTAFLR